MTDTTKLKKGLPPKREQMMQNILTDPRSENVKNRPLQLMITPEVFRAFSAKAGEEFGFSKGSKSLLFLKMWTMYQNHEKN
jgi:hypothetical protein